MRNTNKDLENLILEKTLELLQTKEPYEIGMRDIAKSCNVTATSIYLYFKDKNDLFRHISIQQIKLLEQKMQEKFTDEKPTKQTIILALKTFRDWCFENPKTALLFMDKIDVDPDADLSELSPYYICNRLGESLLRKCDSEGTFKSKQFLINTNILIFGLWGCIESVLRQRSDIELWNKGIEYTDQFIDIALKGIEE